MSTEPSNIPPPYGGVTAPLSPHPANTAPYPPLPYTGIVPPAAQKRRSGWILAGSVIGGVLLFLVIAAITVYSLIAGAFTTTLSPTLGNSKYYSQYPDTSGPGSTVQVGQTITVSHLSCTVTSAGTLPGDDIEQPSAGNNFIVVHVRLVNNGDHELQYDPFNFHIKTGTGSITDESFLSPASYTANNRLDVGKLTPSGSVEGDIILQVPLGDHKAQLVWNPSILDASPKYAWDLGL